MPLLVKRILASVIDYAIIGLYATALFSGVTLLASLLHLKLDVGPVLRQLIGFVTLTLPVFLYSYLMERSAWRGTIGKKILRLQIRVENNPSKNPILPRNILKYIPWEFAHTGVHWIVYYSSNGAETPMWVWTVLIIPQLVAFAYLVSMIASKGRSSWYDSLCGTQVTEKS